MATDNLFPECYVDYEAKRQQKLMSIDKSPDRFQAIEKRDNSTVFSTDALKAMFYGKYQTNWKGIERMKGCTEITIYEELLWDLKPKTLIEIGSYKGGSALWLADMMTCFNLSGHMYSLDKDHTYLDPKAVAPNLTFIQGDVFEIEKSLTPEILEKFPHPWLIMEDAHFNLLNVLNYFHRFMLTGDYFIVEDTNQKIPSKLGMGLYGTDWEELGTEKMTTVREFLEQHPGQYGVDAKYTDMFGYNGGSNMNSYLKRL